MSARVENFSALRVGLATSEDIRSWSSGEVKKPETINYRTLKPEKDGLFCEKIFGPTKDWECSCGKYKRVRFKGIVCERCGVEVTKSSVRRERMGHIELAAPVTHIWYFKGVPSRLGYLLNMAPKDLEKIIYFAAYRVMQIDQELRDGEYDLVREEYVDRIRALVTARDEEFEAAASEEIAELRELGLELQISNKFWEAPRWVEKQFAKDVDQLITAEEKDADAFWSARALGAETEEEQDDAVVRTADETKRIKKLMADFKKKTDKIVREYARLERPANLQKEQVAWRMFLTATKGQLLPNDVIFDHFDYYFSDYVITEIGAEAVLQVLADFDLEGEAAMLRAEIATTKGSKQTQAIKRLKVVNSFLQSGTPPTSMVLSVLPVLPPEIRPMVQLDGGRFATSDLNDLYRRVINRNNRLKRFVDLGAVPKTILNNEKRMLQEAVDALFDNGRRGRAVTGTGNRALKSLSDLLKGKQGRFRQNLLGKRVDYSGRSVIVVGPQLKLHQCGLPKLMALELFKPFVMKRLVDLGLAQNIKSAKRMVERSRPQVWGALEDVIKERPVLLNRAPTLHRLGIQAFEPVLVEGKAIQLHPLVCAAFNADFDGDQMAVHLPLSVEAQAEARILMLASNNILKPSDGRPVASPTQDMIIGIFHLTSEVEGGKGEGNAYSSMAEAQMAYDIHELDLGAKVRIRIDGEIKETTFGRALFNQALPANYPYVNEQVGKKQLGQIVSDLVELFSRTEVAACLDELKDAGFYWATRSGVSMSISDANFDPKGNFEKKRAEMIAKAEKQHTKIQEAFDKGLKSDLERRDELGELWSKETKEIQELLQESIPQDNAIFKMVTSGARGNWLQIRSIMGMRGPVATSSGDFAPMPVKGNYLLGLTAHEYFTNATGARKGNADTAMKTAAAGYLTRRLVDVAQDVIIQIEDCGTTRGLDKDLMEDDQVELSIIGRSSLADVKVGKDVLVTAGENIDHATVRRLKEAGIETIMVRSVLTCEAESGICAACYGVSLATNQKVNVGEAIGIIAAQSIGEPGTQLTMRTFHTGGAAENTKKQTILKSIGGQKVRVERLISYDITQGLNGVTDLLEARVGWRQAGKVAALAFWPGRVDIVERGSILAPGLGRVVRVETQVNDLWRSTIPGEVVHSARIIYGLEGKKPAPDIKPDTNIPRGLCAAKSGKVLRIDEKLNLIELLYDDGTRAEFKVSDTIILKKDAKRVGEGELLVREGDVFEAGDTLVSGYLVIPIESSSKKFALSDETLSKRVEFGSPLAKWAVEDKARLFDVFVRPISQEGVKAAELVATQWMFSRTASKTFKKLSANMPLATVSSLEEVLFEHGEIVEAGDVLIEGTPIPQEVMFIKGAREAAAEIIRGVQAIYGSQGVPLHDKHLEVIVRQMLSKVTVIDSGDTDMLPGEIIDRQRFANKNREAVSKGLRPASARQEVMGMTRASLAAQSWLSAASFQETTRVLTQAALDRREDKLVGLKENVIIGKLIPAGTGMNRYRNFEVDGTEEAKAEKYPNRIWSDASFEASDYDSEELQLSVADPFSLDEN